MREKDFLNNTVVPLATKWLKDCIASYPSCGKPPRHCTVFCSDNSLLISDLEGQGLVATRLLFFPLYPPSDETDVVRLQLSESLSLDTRYVALSHRWGTNETCCTNKANLKEMIETGIQTSKLPATFREAVYVARGMGLSYIWIDSLCIVQDDKDDWKMEAQRMAVIYDNATCTIAANDGIDSNAGLFVQNPDLKSDNLLDSRAWVCQERMVSPRSLIFTGDSAVWECRECDASVSSPELKFRRARGAEETPTHPKDIFTYFRDWRLPLKEQEPARVVEDEDSYDEEGTDSQTEDISVDGIIYNAEIDSTSGRVIFHSGTMVPDSDSILLRDSTTNLSLEEAVRHTEDLTSTCSVEERETLRRGYSPEFPDSDYDYDGYPAYKGGLPGHDVNMAIFLEGRESSRPYAIYPDRLRESDPDPFGDFMVVVSDLDRPQRNYLPFLKTWWSFLSNYSLLSLTYGSDKFLAINGITTVAQRWSHLRSSFGLFYHFLEMELLWYVDPDGPPGGRQENWLVPTWSWASTRNGRVKNDMYTRMPFRGKLLIKPMITPGIGTAFDQPLPFVAWMARRYHTINVKGDLRKGVVTAVNGDNGKTRYPIVLDRTGSFSDEEVHDFRPDCAEDFPIGQPVNVLYMVWYHYDAKDLGLAKYIDIGLVFKQMKGETEITMHEEDVPRWVASEQRLLVRIGYLETTYPAESLREYSEFMSELTWYYARLA
ncbi:heterokaryon incompatibility protein [Colletotrichum incanum]|uniref:Heterokaryon incompatibility protein n=1 Tax=Colletotrichum incanum TaxID=1573173 RepID=A0A167BIJ1_COLIC|nr:heterokaryon incompatibility protein [Colletotrichum incanum]